MMTLKAGIQLGNDKTSVLSLVLLYCFVFCFFNESSLVLCDDLDGWNEGLQEEGDICICTADSCWYTAKTNTTL